jgi:hypothetical protein
MFDPEYARARTGRIVGLIILAPFFVAIFGAVFGFAVRGLWNWLMPLLFGLPMITFWQAWGLMLLSWILLGGFRGLGGHGRSWRRERRERWAHWRRMTPEQRAAVREAFGSRWACPPREPSAADAGPEEVR